MTDTPIVRPIDTETHGTVVDPNIVPHLIDPVSGTTIAILRDAYDVIITDELISASAGQEVLDFKLPFDTIQRGEVLTELLIKANGRLFHIRTPRDGWDASSPVPVTTVHCEALWYELAEKDPIQMTAKVTPTSAMTAILAGTGWTVGTVEPTAAGSLTIADKASPLAALRLLPQAFGGELEFDTINRQVHLLNQRGSASVVALYAHGRNLSGNARTEDTTNLVTRLYVYGAQKTDTAGNYLVDAFGTPSLTDITSVNGGLAYLEDYSFYDTRGVPHVIRAATVVADGMKDPTLLKAWGVAQLAALSRPSYTYSIQQINTGASDVAPELGDVVRVHDNDLGIDVAVRVRARVINVTQPWLTTYTLDAGLFTLSSALVGGGGSGGVIGGTGGGAVDNTIPSAPTAVSISSLQSFSYNQTLLQIEASWAQVTTNTDSTAIADLDHYDVEWQLTSPDIVHGGTQTSAWSQISVPAGTTLALLGVTIPNVTVTVRVRAVDVSGNAGAWTLFGPVALAADTVAPPPPSTPTFVATSLPGVVKTAWDGKDNTGAAMPADFLRLDVHASTAGATFVPDVTTLVDSLSAAGTSILALAAGSAWYVKFVAVDTSLNTSISASATVTPRLIQSTDILNNAITNAQIATDAVDARAIAASAVTATELASGAVTAAKTALAAIDSTSGAITAGAVGTTQLVNGAITAVKTALAGIDASTGNIAAAAVGTTQLVNGSITAVKTALAGIDSTTGGIAAAAVGATQLAANAVTSAAIASAAVTAAKTSIAAINAVTGALAAGSVTTTTITDGSISTPKIAANAVTAGQIAANTITSAQIAADTITAAQIAAGGVTASELAAGSVTAAAIAANTITAAQIAADTITAAQIAANAITASELAANSVYAGALQASSVTAAAIAANTITSAQIAADTITAAQIAANAITSSELAANSVYAGALQANSVTAAAIAAGTITATQIATDTITAAQIAAGAVTASELAAGSVTAAAIAASAVTAGAIAAGTITAGSAIIANGAIAAAQMVNATITTAQIAAGTILSANIANATIVGANIASATIQDANIANVNVGKLVAGSLTADVTVSARIKTANTGARAEMSGTGFYLYDSVGNALLNASITGGVATLNVIGNINAGSVLPISVYTNSSVVNGIMEDVAPGAALPMNWASNGTTGTGSIAMETVSPLSGTRSITLTAPNNTSGASAISTSKVPCVVGEHWVVKLDARVTGATAASNAVTMRVYFYDSAGVLITTAPAAPITPQVLTVNGVYVTTPASATAVGYADVVSAWAGWTSGTIYRLAGEVTVPAGAASMAISGWLWTTGTASANSCSMTIDNAYLARSGVGEASRSGYVTGAWLRTAESGKRIEIGTAKGTTYAYNVQYFYTGWTTSGGVGESIAFGPFYPASYPNPMQGYIAADATTPSGGTGPTGDATGTMRIQAPKIDADGTSNPPSIMLQSAILPGTGSATVWDPHSGSITLQADGGTKIQGQIGASNKVLIFDTNVNNYTWYADNTGPGTSGDRIWLDAPNGGAVYLGPRVGTSYLSTLQIRSGQVLFVPNTTVDFQMPLPGAPGGPVYRYLYQVVSGGTVNRVYGGVNVSSSIEAKRDLKPYTVDVDRLLSLKPQRFRYKSDIAERGRSKAPWNVGLAGEHIMGDFPELVHLDNEGKVVTVHYDRIGLMLTPVVSDLRDEVFDLKTRLTAAERKIRKLEAA